MLAACGQWVDKSYTLQKALLGLLECRGDHSGAQQASLIAEVLERFEIRRVGYHTGDNASSNNTCLDALSKKLKEEREIDFDPVRRRIRCFGHAFNLCLQAFLLASSNDSIERNGVAHILPYAYNDGPAVADRFVLESGELAALNLTFVDNYEPCVGQNTAASPRIRCVWDNVKGGESQWSKFGIRLGYWSEDYIDLPFTLTSFVKDADSGALRQSDQTSETHRFAVTE